MKKQLLTAVALVATLSELNAHIFGEGGLVDNSVNTALNAPGDVVRGPNRPNRREGLFRRNNNNRSNDYSEEFADYNPEL